MTRDEAIKAINDNAIQEYAGSSQYYLEKEDYYEIINKIFDDFESRTCKYCKHFNSFDGIDLISIDCNQYDLLCGTPINKDFGCNRFKRKNNERD